MFDGILIGAAAVVVLHGRLVGWYAVPDSASTTNRSPAEGFFVFAGLMLLGLLGQGVAASLQSSYLATELEVHTSGLLLSLPLQVVLLATVTRFLPTLPVSHRISSKADIGLGIRRFLPVWLAVVGVATASSLMRQVVVGEPSDPVGHASLAMLIESSGWVVPTFVLMVTLAVPWLEEVAFRGFLQPALSRLLGSARWGVVATAGLFAAAHLGAVQWDGLPGLFLLGLGLGILRDQTGRIESAVVVHMLFNLLNLVLTWISTTASV